MTELDIEAKKARALELRLVHGKQISQVAAELGVTPRAVYRWFAEPGTRAIIQRHRDGQLLDLVDIAFDGAHKAMITMLAIVDDRAVSAGVRLAAARHIIDVALKLLEAQGFADRLAALEQRAGIK